MDGEGIPVYVSMCLSVYDNIHGIGIHVKVREQLTVARTFLLQCRSKTSNSGHKAWQQTSVLVPVEPSLWPLSLVLC